MKNRLFANRTQAGCKLAEKLGHLRTSSPIVLALPRGGVPVGFEVATALKAPLDLLFVRKIGAPGQPELAAGAVVDGVAPRTVINYDVANALGLSSADIARSAVREVAEIERRRQLWLDGRKPISVAGRTIIVVDDGVATGSSLKVALQSMRAAGVGRLVIAIPVAPAETAASLRQLCDEAVFLVMARDFLSVGFFYKDFHQLDDHEVTDLLERADVQQSTKLIVQK